MKFKFQFVELWSPVNVDCEVEAATLEEAKEMVDADGVYNFVAEEQSEGAFDPPDTSDPVWEGETPAPIENVVEAFAAHLENDDDLMTTLDDLQIQSPAFAEWVALCIEKASNPVWEGETPAPIENVVASSDGDEILNTLVGSLCKGCFEIYRKECEDTQKEN